jgi:hypothetical protein
VSKKSQENRAKRAKAKAKASRVSKNTPKPIDPLKAQEELSKLFDPANLTTPTEVNEEIIKFCKTISNKEPFFIDSLPEPWSRQSCCDLNVKEFIKLNGGKIVCGYKIWYNKPNYIEAERHAIWEGDSDYRDVSFNSDGEKNILFLPDVEEQQNSLEQNKDKMRWGKDSKTKKLISLQNQAEEHASIRKMSDQEAWDTMLSYEDWLEGRRMPNIIQKEIS